MADIRQFNRIPYVASATLEYRDSTFKCRIENISMAGALISLENTFLTDYRSGNICILNIFDELKGRHITIEVLVAHYAFAYVGLRFLKLDTDTQMSLEMIMERGNMGMADCSLPKSSIHRPSFTEN